jgi:quaternary ammonium compound-resistance protein SugE
VNWSPSTSQAWLLLLAAGLLEVGWAVGMKTTDGFTRPVPTAIVTGLAMKTLPVGTAYAVWVGIGAAGAALLGMWLYSEPAGAARLLCIALIVGGVIGLKLLHE